MSLKHHHQFMWGYSKSLVVKIFRRPAFIFLGITTFTVMGFFSVIMFLIERTTNPKFDTYLDSVYFTVSTMTSVGFGDIVPITPWGKAITTVMMLLGTFIFVSFTGVVATTVLELELEVRHKQNK